MVKSNAIHPLLTNMVPIVNSNIPIWMYQSKPGVQMSELLQAEMKRVSRMHALELSGCPLQSFPVPFGQYRSAQRSRVRWPMATDSASFSAGNIDEVNARPSDGGIVIVDQQKIALARAVADVVCIDFVELEPIGWYHLKFFQNG